MRRRGGNSRFDVEGLERREEWVGGREDGREKIKNKRFIVAVDR